MEEVDFYAEKNDNICGLQMVLDSFLVIYFKSITWEKYGPIFTFPVDHYTSTPPPEILFVLYSQHLSCRYPAKMDTPIIWTAVKSLVKINYRSLTEISFCYYGLSLMRTLTQGPCSVLYKGSWLYYCIMYCLLQQSISPKSIDVVVQFYPSFTFYFPLFWGMGMYDNGFGIKKGTFKPTIKLNDSIVTRSQM